MHHCKKKIEIQEKELEVLRKAVINRERNILREERIKLSTSLVISGIKESRNEKPSETRKIVENLLNSVESEVEVLSAERVGRFDGKYPRLIKIKTEDKEERRKLLEQSNKLRKLPDYQQVYVNPDRCFLDRKEDKRLRNVAKFLRAKHPEKKVFIKNGKVIMDDNVVEVGNPLRHLFDEQ